MERKIRNQIENIKCQKIINAVHFFFKQDDVYTAKVWNISQENSTTISLINYYYGNKKLIFNEIIVYNTRIFFKKLGSVLNDRKTNTDQKIEFVVLQYVDLILHKPDFAVFIIYELLSDSVKEDIISLKQEFILNSYFMEQISELKKYKANSSILILTIVNLIRMMLLPLVYNENSGLQFFKILIEERKKLLPLWISSSKYDNQ